MAAKRFKPGDHVSWNSEAGRVRGRITRVVTSPTKFKGYTVHASRDEPQYEIKSDTTDHIAMHKGSAGTAELSPNVRLQILTTEHWSLLSTRALSWNETSSRTAAFLAALSGAVVALALVAQASAFGESFAMFALLILPVVLFLGVATFVRLVEINHENVRWVIGMNLLRHAYLEAAPELRPYFITGWHDDEAGIMTTFGARVGPGGFAHEFVTAPGVLAVVDGILAGVIAGILGPRLGAGNPLTLGLVVVVGVLTIAVLAAYQYRGAVRPRARRHPRFPEAATGSNSGHPPDLEAAK